MHFPTASAEQIERYQRDGFIIVENAVSPQELDQLRETSQALIAGREKLAFDWDWRKGEQRTERAFRIVQCPLTSNAPWIVQSRMRKWCAEFSTALMQKEMIFWYDQFLGKPPQFGSPTPWHQDEAYWGRNLFDKGITCWMACHDVDESNGCMHFIPGAHKWGVVDHINPPEMASDLLVFTPPADAPIVPARMKAGSVTFHHSKMPHMTTGNSSDRWREVLAQHFSSPGCQAEGDHYSWRVHVNQHTGERVWANEPKKEVLA